MVLVAATAIGLALARARIDHAFWMFSGPARFSDPASLFLLVFTVVYIPIRLRGPRPSLLRLMRQPGTAACAAVVIVMTIDEIIWILYCVRNSYSAAQTQPMFWRVNSDHVPPAVAAVWLGMLFSRRFRPEPCWIDRFGRAIGFLWLLKLAIGWPFLRWAIVVTNLFQ
jgi:hypothetical protein